MTFSFIAYRQQVQLQEDPHVANVLLRGNFWNLTQIEYEHQRLLQTLAQFSAEPGKVTADDVRFRFDILWSRFVTLKADLAVLPPFLAEDIRITQNNILRTMRTADPWVATFGDRDLDAARTLYNLLKPYETEIHNILLDVHRPIFSKEMVEKLEANRKAINNNNLWMLGSFALAMMMLLIELIVSHSRTVRERTARIAVEQADAAKVSFLANMSHELRTPLNAIIGFSEVMAKQLFGPITNQTYVSYANDIHQSGAQLLDLVNDVLDIARIEAGVASPDAAYFDPLIEAEHCVRTVRRMAWEKQLTLVVVPDSGTQPTMLYADQRQIRQTLLNLLANAIKFTPRGGDITVWMRAGTDALEIVVSDTGVGIPQESLDKATQAFFQVSQHQTRKHGGVGLGLAIARSFVEANRGRLIIESTENVGTTVTLWFPAEIIDRQPMIPISMAGST